MTAGLKILVVDDEAEARESIAEILRNKGFEVVTLANGADTLAKVKEIWPTVIILDIVLPDYPGTEVLKELRADPVTRGIPVLLLTAKPNLVTDLLPDFSNKLDRFMEKPGKASDLLDMLRSMMTRSN